MKFSLSAPILTALAAASFAAAAPAHAQSYPPVVIQFGPTTTYSTIACPNFTKLPDGNWKAIVLDQKFGLGFVQNIIPPRGAIKAGGWIYNNIDLYSQLELQCAPGALVRARY